MVLCFVWIAKARRVVPLKISFDLRASYLFCALRSGAANLASFISAFHLLAKSRRSRISEQSNAFFGFFRFPFHQFLLV